MIGWSASFLVISRGQLAIKRELQLLYPFMLAAIVALAAMQSSGVLVVDNLGVGVYRNGKWSSLDSIMLSSWPKKTQDSSFVDGMTAQGGYMLSEGGSVSPFNATLTFKGSEDPGDRGWIMEPRIHEGGSVIWFGPKPSNGGAKMGSTTSPAVVKATRTFLATVGYRNARPVINTVVVADVDGNGSQDTLIFASSRKPDRMYERLNVGLTGVVKKDYSVVLLTSGGKTTKVYSSRDKDSADFHWDFGGLWQLDGKPGLELIARCSAYETSWSDLVNLRGGRATTLATAGDGV